MASFSCQILTYAVLCLVAGLKITLLLSRNVVTTHRLWVNDDSLDDLESTVDDADGHGFKNVERKMSIPKIPCTKCRTHLVMRLQLVS